MAIEVTYNPRILFHQHPPLTFSNCSFTVTFAFRDCRRDSLASKSPILSKTGSSITRGKVMRDTQTLIGTSS